MDWLICIILGGAAGAFLVLKQLTLLRPRAAHSWLNKGAEVVDVRSEAEFAERHLPGAVNIPLDRLRDASGWIAPKKEQPLLLHSQTGTRSGMGKTMLRKMGYPNVFNLGSYERAERILGTWDGIGSKGDLR